MYDLKRIADCIEHPDKMIAQDVELFGKLSKEHSDTPILSLLYLQAVSKFTPLSFEKNLKEHAYKIPSRKRLFELLEEIKDQESNHAQSLSEETGDPKGEETIAEESSELENELTSELDVQINDFSDKRTEKGDLQRNNDLNRLSEDESKDKTYREIELKEDSKQTSEIKIEENKLDGLEKEIMAHAVGASISLDVDEYISQESFNQPLDTESSFKDDDDLVGELSSTTEQEIDFNQERSFTEWLSVTSKKTNSDDFAPNRSEEQKKKKKNEIKITEKKALKPFFSAIEKAKESLDYTGIPITETLAKIYDAQGNYPRALEAYEQLILKIPEKKVFFAVQIEKLKKKINN